MESVSTEFKILKVFFRHCKCKLLCFFRVTPVHASFCQAHENSKLQKPGVAILIPNKIDFKTEIITKGKNNILIRKKGQFAKKMMTFNKYLCSYALVFSCVKEDKSCYLTGVVVRTNEITYVSLLHSRYT